LSLSLFFVCLFLREGNRKYHHKGCQFTWVDWGGLPEKVTVELRSDGRV
jgi:hypothetical protein